MVYEFDGTKYEKLRDMRAARRAKHRTWCAATWTPSRPLTTPDAPSHARSCPAHDRGTRPRPAPTSTGAPERIGGRLRRGHPDNGSMNACHETIHQTIHAQGKGEPRLQPKHAMRRGHVARRHRGDGQSRRPQVPRAHGHDRRPAGRGRREGDLTCGAATAARSAPSWNAPPGPRSSHTCPTGTTPNTCTTPSSARCGHRPRRRTTALHETRDPNPPRNACPPHSTCRCTSATLTAPGSAAPTRTPTACRASTPPPTGTDPSGYTEEHLDAIAMEPDDRPRKTPDYMKPSEKIPELTDDTATSTPTDTNNTNCQKRRCNNH